MYNRKRLPKSQFEFTEGRQDERFPRSNQIRRDQDNLNELSIGLRDIDYTIKWYFDNIIRPEIDEFGSKVAVPVIYGSPEKWKSMQSDGYFRDKEGKIQVPLIAYRRTGITKNKTLGSKVDGNYPQLYYTEQVKYSNHQRYDQFSVLTNRKPSGAFINTVIPDYVDITYDVIIWTDYMEHMNGLVESVLYTEGSYWGEPDKFKFRTKIDNFTNTTDLLQDSDRTIRTTFSLGLSGYIITKELVRSLSNKQSNLTFEPGEESINFTPSGST